MRTILVFVTCAALFYGPTNAQSEKQDTSAKQQAEALEFVKDCVRQIKRHDVAVLKVVTDANILLDVEAELKKQSDKPIDWDNMFGRLSELTDEQIANLFQEVLMLRLPMMVSNQVLTDKRQPKERKVDGIYMRFEANVAPECGPVYCAKWHSFHVPLPVVIGTSPTGSRHRTTRLSIAHGQAHAGSRMYYRPMDMRRSRFFGQTYADLP